MQPVNKFVTTLTFDQGAIHTHTQSCLESARDASNALPIHAKITNGSGFRNYYVSSNVCVREYIYMYIYEFYYVCVCMYVRARTYTVYIHH